VKKIFIALLVLSLSVAGVGSVLAQNAPESTAEAMLTSERETERIAQLRVLYRDEVEAYRNAEKAFTIAKTNFNQVQTLAALEEAVNATQKVMFERSRVMITYLELIDAVLIETKGIELDLKNQTHIELTGLINTLKIHQENIVVSKDRQAMVLLANEFEPISVDYQSEVYKTLSLVRIGKIQEVHDKAEIIKADIVKEHESQEVSSLVISRRERAYAEIERNFDAVNAGLADLNNLFTQGRREGFSRSFYEKILEKLSPVYVQISRSLDHLDELITL